MRRSPARGGLGLTVRPPSALFAGLFLLALSVPASRGEAQSPDSAFAQISRLVDMGDRTTAHAMADSLVRALDASTPAYPEALYWRAFTSSNAADAEHDYLRLSVEYSLSPRAADALLQLGQLEYARGDRVSARRHFERLLREHPTGPDVAEANYWNARLAFDDADSTRACRALNAASAHVAADDVELRNRIDYQRGICAGVLARADTGSATDTTRGAQPGAAGAAGSTTSAQGRQYSVQVAAYTAKSSADNLARRLKSRGFDVRVFGTRAPYRVRIGRYATREAAVAALARMRRANVNGIVVEAEPK